MENSEQYEATAAGTAGEAPLTGKRKKSKTVFILALALINMGNLIGAAAAVLIWYYTGKGILAVCIMLLIIAVFFVNAMYLISQYNRQAEYNNKNY